jgi:hypothetical protein
MEYDFEKLAREIVIGRLKDVEDAPTTASEMARKIVVAAVLSTRSRQDPRVTVTDSCRGVMSGMLILEKNLASAAVALLVQMAFVAQEANLDPADCMTWAMEGIAPVAKLAPGGAVDSIRASIEENFMGAGTVFEDILRTAGA